MTFDDFRLTLNVSTPPKDAPALLQALWHDAKGDWEKAHQIAQDIDSPDGSWVHAYLHRKEGDAWNAGYWYRRAGLKMPEVSLEKEWEALARHFLGL